MEKLVLTRHKAKELMEDSAELIYLFADFIKNNVPEEFKKDLPKDIRNLDKLIEKAVFLRKQGNIEITD